MARIFIAALGIVFLMASCSSLRPVNKVPVGGSSNNQVNTAASKSDPRFLNDISVDQNASVVKVKKENSSPRRSSGAASVPATGTDVNRYLNRSSSVEKASALQLKYSVLLNTEVEYLVDNQLLEHVDEWYGTPYRLGGSTKKGIDCSAFVQAVYLSAFAVSVPRTAREQYKFARIVSATELREGDLVFFNTTGGVSHVGIYLGDRKFVHAPRAGSVVRIESMDIGYWRKRYNGARRLINEDTDLTIASSSSRLKSVR